MTQPWSHRSPLRLTRAAAKIDDPRENEEQVRETVHVPKQHGIDRRLERHDPALGAAANGASNVQRRASGRAAGEDEATEGRQLLLEPIDQVLETIDLGVANDRLGDARRE